VSQVKKSQLFENIENDKDFYFVHSYTFDPEDKSVVVSQTDYGDQFVSTIAKDNIYGVQFHPEKSLDNGISLLKNFLKC